MVLADRAGGRRVHSCADHVSPGVERSAFRSARAPAGADVGLPIVQKILLLQIAAGLLFALFIAIGLDGQERDAGAKGW